jgi:NADH-quinone oxidoreductase, chain G
MPKLTIDDQEVEVGPGLTVLQACEAIGIEIPRFCYHERLSIAGNCRMCLVSLKGSPKPVASCAMPAADGMVVTTDSPAVRDMRRGVMEFLLINHPLDCPICDQGGECDLQDLAMGYGFDRGRYSENKRAVQDKDFGPLVKTVMTRCIHCTRCIRFATEVAGVPELGATGRGESMEVGTYIKKALSSELSGNIIDLCPVGALTSKPYAFVARPWELNKTESIDVMDAVGSNIRVDYRGEEVLRVLPRLNEAINEEWISDKTRFACDGLRRQRLDRPYVRRNGRLAPATWAEAFSAIVERLQGVDGRRIAAIAGDLACTESMFALKALFQSLGSPHVDCRQDGAALPAAPRASYLFNSSIAGIDQATACLLIGTNPRVEAAIINGRLGRRFRQRQFPVALIGPGVDLTYPYEHLGDSVQPIDEIAGGWHPFAEKLRAAERPMVIVGMGALARPDGAAILAASRRLADSCGLLKPDQGWNGFNVLHTAAARVGGLDLGFVPADGGYDVAGMQRAAETGDIEVVYLLGADEFDTQRLGRAFVIYQGHHGDAGASRADVILPGAAYTEKDATYVNTEGRVQRAELVCHPPGEAKEDWAIIRALSERLGHKLPFDSLGQLRSAMTAAVPVLGDLHGLSPAAWGEFGVPGPLDVGTPLSYPISNFYLTNPICRTSATMARCVDAFVGETARRTGTDD